VRLRLLVLAGALILLASISSARRAAAGARETPAVSDSYVVVHAGDTLWGLGRRYAPPGEDLRRWIFDVERINDLAADGLRPGQRLRLPGPGGTGRRGQSDGSLP
jgi:nucleoid-associated protein YgaU